MVPVSCVLYTPNFQDEITGTQHTHGRIDRTMPAGKVSETKHSRKNTNIDYDRVVAVDGVVVLCHYCTIL